MTLNPVPSDVLERHLRLMRLATVGFLGTIPVAAAAMVLVTPREGVAAPLAVSLVAAAAALWVGFSANNDAQARIDRIKRAYAASGSEERLLRDHRLVNIAVLARLELMVVAALVARIWGGSAATGWGVLALATVMMALSWPTAEKTVTLLDRARQLRGR